MKKLLISRSMNVLVLLTFIAFSCSSRKIEEPKVIISKIINDDVAMEIATSASATDVYLGSHAENWKEFKMWIWKPESWKVLGERYPAYVSVDTISYERKTPERTVDLYGEPQRYKASIDCTNPPLITYRALKSFKTDSTYIIFYNIGMEGKESVLSSDTTTELSNYCHEFSKQKGYIGASAFKRIKEGWVLSKSIYDLIPLEYFNINNEGNFYVGDAGNLSGSPTVVVYTANHDLNDLDDFSSRFFDYSLNELGNYKSEVAFFEHEISVADIHSPTPTPLMHGTAHNIYENFRKSSNSNLPPSHEVAPFFTLKSNRYSSVTFYKYDYDKGESLDRGVIILKGKLNSVNRKLYFDDIWYNYHNGTAHGMSQGINKEVVAIADAQILRDRINERNRRETERLTNSHSSSESFVSDGQKCQLCSIGRYVNGTCNMCGTVSQEKETSFYNDLRSRNQDRLCRFCQGTGRIDGDECYQCIGTGVSPR